VLMHISAFVSAGSWQPNAVDPVRVSRLLLNPVLLAPHMSPLFHATNVSVTICAQETGDLCRSSSFLIRESRRALRCRRGLVTSSVPVDRW
jgi:hypothetical protein